MKTKHIKRKGTLLSSVAMLGTAMLLTACGGDGGDSPVDDFGSNPGEGDNQALLYAYPDNGQGEISTAAPVVLRFSSAVNLGNANNAITMYEGDAATGSVVNAPAEAVSGEPNNVTLNPDEDLKPNQLYTVVIEDLPLRKGTAKDQTLTFTTRPLHEGPKSLVVKDDAFEVSRRMPDGSAMEPVMDFSSFRFQFTQPIDRATANYGEDPASTGPGGGTIPADSVVLRDSSGAPVPATLLIDGAYMTVDPDQEYLNAGETYTLEITAGLTSTYGETLGAQSYTLTPKDSSPNGAPAILVQKLTQGSTSRLTGKPVNEVPVNGTLLGENKNITQASAEVVRAELADVTTYTDVTPIRLPKGTVLNGAEINPILIGGEVPAGFGSGDVTMTVLSDASGYLVPNPYAENNPDALRIVHLLMDVGIATSEARANGAFTQDLLHIELVGLAEVDPTAGVLNLDAVSVVEPNILGQEYGYGMLSFQLQSYKDQNNPPQVTQDTTPPELQSWVPGDNADVQKPSDPIILNYDESIDPDSIQAGVHLYRNGQEVDYTAEVDGGAVIIQPRKYLDADMETNAVNYRLQIDPAPKDLSGNQATSAFDETFSLPLKVELREQVVFGNPTGFQQPAQQRSPVVLAVYPGFPCALVEEEVSLSEGDIGRCAGGFPGWDQGTSYDLKDEDDHMPLPELPGERPIAVQFSKNIDPNSVQLGGSFKVESVDSSGAPVEEINGELTLRAKSLIFYPETPWEKDKLYRYVLGSNDNLNSSVAACDGTGSICDDFGLPLQTQVLGMPVAISEVGEPEQPEFLYKLPEREWKFVKNEVPATSGGPDMIQYFSGGDGSNTVLQSLSALPSHDTNNNFIHEKNEDIKDGAALATFPLASVYQYVEEEKGAEDQPLDARNNEEYDPNGVLAPPNSAKVVSTNSQGVVGIRKAPDVVATLPINGTVIGCGYGSPATNFDDSDPELGQYAPPLNCPEQKFTYLTGALFAEVTSEYDEARGLKVSIWPSNIIASSLYVRQKVGPGTTAIITESGMQVLRMRYSEDELGNRVEPITGWITQEGDELVLQAVVDLYMDGPELKNKGLVSIIDPVHSLLSYPITMELTGSVEFLDDGRMVIEQYNINPVNIDIRVQNRSGAWVGSLDLLIPAYGNRLNFISEPIK
ncbi:MAG: hypothetical protein CL553_01305 [Alcanivorax sp.]|nr:hypothetical protein [Alcanivorax sp.]|tara:strand:- start:6179 stop:9643 length:3465 start_codon:yes stop_codon:yes gene_type:complete